MAAKRYPISARFEKLTKKAYEDMVDDVNRARKDAGLSEISASDVLRRIVERSIKNPPEYLSTER